MKAQVRVMHLPAKEWPDIARKLLEAGREAGRAFFLMAFRRDPALSTP